MFALPQEIEVWYIIPSIRREIAKNLVEKHKISYQKTGEILGISKAAISQYLSNKRAKKVNLHEEIKKEIEKSCQRIIKNNKESFREIQRILQKMRRKKYTCEICKKYNQSIIKYCEEKNAY